MRLLLLLALFAANASAASVLFDGARGPRHTVPRLPPPPPKDFVLDILRGARVRFGYEPETARLPPVGPGGAFQFVVVGDAEPGRFFFERVFPPGRDAYERLLGMMQARSPQFIVQMGDFVSRGTAKNYLGYLGLLERAASTPLIHVVGNHDREHTNWKPADKSFYKALFGESTDRYLDRGGWRLVFLDDSDSRLTDAQLDWLDATLATAKNSLVFMHIPPVYLYKRLDGTGKERPEKALSEKPPKGYFTQGAARFREIVSRRSVRRVYMGHIHAYGAEVDEGVCYVLTAAGGSPVYPARAHAELFKTHFLSVSVSGDALSEELTTLEGETRSLPGPCPTL